MMGVVERDSSGRIVSSSSERRTFLLISCDNQEVNAVHFSALKSSTEGLGCWLEAIANERVAAETVGCDEGLEVETDSGFKGLQGLRV